MNANPIRVDVETEYLAEHSQPENNHYAFAYHITITNQGEQAAQLISRHWVIVDGNDSRQEIQGRGVVGQQPLIGPGQKFHYSSGLILATKAGTMTGEYHMTDIIGNKFSALVPTFLLAIPGAIH
jgi:ApaG protein